MTYKIHLAITLRSSILDPQGKATHHALNELGFSDIESVRMGKFVEIWVEADDPSAAREVAERACGQLLANPVMEDYRVLEIEEVAVES